MYFTNNTNVIERAGTIQYMSNIGKVIVERRSLLGMTQATLAKKSGVSQGTIGHLESGRNSTSTKLPQIASALGMTVEELVSAKPGSPLAASNIAPLPAESSPWIFRFDKSRYDRLSAPRKRTIELLVLGQISEWEDEDKMENRHAS